MKTHIILKLTKETVTILWPRFLSLTTPSLDLSYLIRTNPKIKESSKFESAGTLKLRFSHNFRMDTKENTPDWLRGAANQGQLHFGITSIKSQDKYRALIR
jgi:hypothetical protein